MKDAAKAYNESHEKLQLINKEGQQLLQNKKVLVIGAGGLGCPCLQILAGCGIGEIGIADFDQVALGNLHRQALFQYDTIGQSKAVIASKVLKQHNPFIKINCHEINVDEKNVLELISNYDIMVDACDNFYTRYLLNDACVYLNKPLVYGAIHKTEGHVTVFNYQNSGTLRCLFPDDENTALQSCADIGAYNVTTSIIGTMMANEVVKIIMNHTEVLANKLYQFDAINGQSVCMAYQPEPNQIKKSFERFTTETNSTDIEPATLIQMLQSKNDLCLIDIREPQQHQHANIGGINLPLNTILQSNELDVPKNATIILYCQKGNNSKMAVSILKNKGYNLVFSLLGGIDNWTNHTSRNN